METLTIDHGNGNSTTYQLVEDGGNLPIAYHAETPKAVVETMERLRKNGTRIRLYYGDVATGRDWLEENDVTGRIGLSRGHKARFPILIATERSIGGSPILDHCIVKIKAAGAIAYIAANYQQPKIEVVPSDTEVYSHMLKINGKIYSRHRSERSAKVLKSKLS